jgi:hypothetical protein
MRRARNTTRPFYPLAEVKNCLANCQYRINPDCLNDAQNDFGWNEAEVVAALLKLEESMFYGSDTLKHKPETVIDKYRCPKLHGGENVYTHFYINDNIVMLIINSFKQL